jgi:hypothetical protein
MIVGLVIIIVVLVAFERWVYRRSKAVTALLLMAEILDREHAWTVEAIQAAKKAGIK